MRHGRARAQKRAAQVDVEHRIPVGGGQLVERPLHVHRRHVDQDVEASERGDGAVDERRRRVQLRQVGLQRGRAAPARTYVRGGLLRFALRTRVAERDVDAARRQFARDDCADAFAAGDQRDGVF